MRQAWREFLATAKPHSHGAQVYAEPAELIESLASFVAAGLRAGEPAILVVRAERIPPLAEALAGAGFGFTAAEEKGLLHVADAEATLAAVLEEGRPAAVRFDAVVGRLLDEAERTATPVRVFGEMVDLLARRGDSKGAEALERLWNDLARRRDFALLCGYGLDIFDGAAQAALLPGVCREHSHVLPARNYPRFARAVDEALRDVLGPAEAANVYLRASREADAAATAHVPLAQLLLMWVARNLPADSTQVLEAAREGYARA
jgi:hypothetical protein